ncbi:MAG: GSCFA domain-containing protein [Muribaculaceae bacterium]|nr:GSCFA domain-containing protein [Muribaculaceae bacterium]
MKFRTEYEARPGGFILNPEQSIVLLGSCFTDYIGKRMRFCRWRAYPNLCGTLYNPSSIANILRITSTWENIFDIIDDSIAQRDNLWISWLSDSGCTRYTKQDTKESVFSRLLDLHNNLKEAKALIVTFGTAWVFELKDRQGYIVSNCHKFPSDTFIRRRLSISEIIKEWNDILKKLSDFNPALKVLFTVSPVRHLKDGFEGNSSSKAILRLACEEICKLSDNADYFPSFEIMNDDLRDYRFYDNDLVHPSDMAVDYIWEKFQDRYLSKASRGLLAEGEKVTRRLQHRPIVFGTSDFAKYTASNQRYEAIEFYNEFITKHPNML